jgi:hypothetical protein
MIGERLRPERIDLEHRSLNGAAALGSHLGAEQTRTKSEPDAQREQPCTNRDETYPV